ncbi:hypothetical protein JYU34_009669 [Plutella xylostella]|uniref:Salivary secreted peptide n=1 Tax=Plutella xylostella TaxID=51655 RepID=A0ABQ7QLD7_PLUXY|nr:hypothetical protein JYU34_009669 [Plutella xylostella]
MIGRVMIVFVVLVIVSVVSGQNNTTDATTAAPGAATTPSFGIIPGFVQLLTDLVFGGIQKACEDSKKENLFEKLFG